MTTFKFPDIFVFIATGFTIANGLLTFLIFGDVEFYQNIAYHYSNNLIWYLLFFLYPLIAGVLFYFWLKNEIITQKFKRYLRLITAIQLTGFILALLFNLYYWGYPFRRPTVFNEVQNSSRILSYLSVSTIDSSNVSRVLHSVYDSLNSIDYFINGNELYYGNEGRVFLVSQDRAFLNSQLKDILKFFNKKELKTSEAILRSLDQQINASKLIDKGKEGWDTSRRLTGLVTEFLTEDSTKYILAGLNGGQVSNDHYPFYEFLFIENNNQFKLIKNQKYYIDVAGIEGMEFATLYPLFSLILTISILEGSLIFTLHFFLFKRKIRRNLSAAKSRFAKYIDGNPKFP